jgi:hypothetical protein
MLISIIKDVGVVEILCYYLDQIFKPTQKLQKEEEELEVLFDKSIKLLNTLYDKDLFIN